jgi:capsule polysaccharide export protein KpsE/RkpR
VASLKTSVSDLKNTNVRANGISAVSDQFTKIQDNLKTVKSDAHGQFSPQINALSSALSTLGSSLTAAKDNLSGGTLTSVASSAGAVVTAGNNLVSTVTSTC